MTLFKPAIILFRGMPGTGKTFVSDMLAERMKIGIIRKDDIYDSVYLHVATHEARNTICYDLIYRVIDTNLKTHTSLIVDCPFREHKDLDRLKEFVLSRQGIFKPILCQCSNLEIWETRFNERSKNPKPNNLLTDFNALKSHYQTLYLKPYQDELVLDTQEAVGSLIEKIENYL